MEESSFLHPKRAVRAAKIHEGMRVADFNAGAGFFTRAAARAAGPEGVVWAVDANRDLLPRIKNLSVGEGLHNVEVMHGDVSRAEGSNLPAESFDFCLAANLLFGVEDKAATLREMRRVLKPRGKALVIDWRGSFGGLGPHPSHVVTAAAAKELAGDEGFTILEDIPAGEYHWGFVARKK
ncbi:MAG: methyltransferase domain-containing protein [Patescibacteria group bacterium]|nr:methyltransferase domain-containing protein [Patescibacteria group bacterium]